MPLTHDSALKCLELALHPGTGDGETLGAVYAFRRKVNGTPLTTICTDLFSKAAHRARYKGWQEKNDEVIRLQEALDTVTNKSRELEDQLLGYDDRLQEALDTAQNRSRELEAQLNVVTNRASELEDKLNSATDKSRDLQAMLLRVSHSDIRPTPNNSDDELCPPQIRRDRWTDDEYEVLALIFEHNSKIPNKMLADHCSKRFGRTITKDAIGSALDRLRKRGRLLKYREGFARTHAVSQ